MLKRFIVALAVASSVAVVGFASGNGGQSAPQKNPYAGIYARSVTAMSLPDQTLDHFVAPNADLPTGEFTTAAAQASKTCSQRCSTTCSKTCTTTRGCSSSCKRQSDGCGGTSTPPPTTTPRTPEAPAATTPLASPRVQLTADITEQNTLNAQRALAIAGYEGFCLTGTYSPAYDAALKDFQARHNLGVTGILTDQTWVALQPLLNRAATR